MRQRRKLVAFRPKDFARHRLTTFMNQPVTNPFRVLAALALALLGAAHPVLSQGTAFTYQGRLNNNGVPATGLYDLRFQLFLDPLGNNHAGSAVLTNAVPVTNGLFTVALDFGPGIFDGSNYWLEVDAKTNNAGVYVDLSPLQAVTAGAVRDLCRERQRQRAGRLLQQCSHVLQRHKSVQRQLLRQRRGSDQPKRHHSRRDQLLELLATGRQPQGQPDQRFLPGYAGLSAAGTARQPPTRFAAGAKHQRRA